MMTKEEHIKYWVDTAGNDWKVTGDTFDVKIICTVCFGRI